MNSKKRVETIQGIKDIGVSVPEKSRRKKVRVKFSPLDTKSGPKRKLTRQSRYKLEQQRKKDAEFLDYLEEKFGK